MKWHTFSQLHTMGVHVYCGSLIALKNIFRRIQHDNLNLCSTVTMYFFSGDSDLTYGEIIHIWHCSTKTDGQLFYLCEVEDWILCLLIKTSDGCTVVVCPFLMQLYPMWCLLITCPFVQIPLIFSALTTISLLLLHCSTAIYEDLATNHVDRCSWRRSKCITSSKDYYELLS